VNLTSRPLRAVAVVVLDSVGIGGAPDADEFGDVGSATLQNVADSVGGLRLPNLAKLGLGNVATAAGVDAVEAAQGAFGIMTELSPGKDTTTGHWELMGVILEHAFPLYPQGFPDEVMDAFHSSIGRLTLGNYPASGTVIIDELGAEHMATGKPIVYTSGDSVFQIAAHTDVVPLEKLYEMCERARAILTGPHEVGRVIARPFTGEPGSFTRTTDRHDFAVEPPSPTVLDSISSEGLEMRGVGKIADIFAGRGVTSSVPTASNDEGIEGTIAELGAISRGLVLTNLVDFDQSFGHRNDPAGYAQALESFDARLPDITSALGEDDVLIVTADHGNDPTTPSTDHSREQVPVLVAGPRVRKGADLGVRSTFADCGASVAELLGVPTPPTGESFAEAAVG
jgi:phosphopentomutase